MSCPICLGIAGAYAAFPDGQIPFESAVAESFLLGVACERAARADGRNVSTLLCADHLRDLRAVADRIPEETCSAENRHLLSLGLSVVR